MKMVLTSYGLDDFHHPLSEESSFYMTRIMKYHAPGETRAGIGLVPHRDKSFMAVIGTNEVEGLEIETPNGEWINFEPSPHRFIVIVGEALMVRFPCQFRTLKLFSYSKIEQQHLMNL